MKLAFTEAKWKVLILVALTAIIGYIYPVASLLPLALLAFLFYFFRDPQRLIEQDEEVILAPADGVVTGITTVDCDYVGNGANRVSIFMSPLNVHVNRVPIAGLVESIAHRPGKYLPAMNPEAPLVNEQRRYRIRGKIPLEVIQVAGIMARRTVSWVKENQTLSQGDKIGMIKLGSCALVTFPAGYRVKVKVGDKVQGGRTIVGEESTCKE